MIILLESYLELFILLYAYAVLELLWGIIVLGFS